MWSQINVERVARTRIHDTFFQNLQGNEPVVVVLPGTNGRSVPAPIGRGVRRLAGARFPIQLHALRPWSLKCGARRSHRFEQPTQWDRQGTKLATPLHPRQSRRQSVPPSGAHVSWRRCKQPKAGVPAATCCQVARTWKKLRELCLPCKSSHGCPSRCVLALYSMF